VELNRKTTFVRPLRLVGAFVMIPARFVGRTMILCELKNGNKALANMFYSEELYNLMEMLNSMCNVMDECSRE
jgi:hypothetical protein